MRAFKNPRLSSLRVFPVRDFAKHLVFYRETAAGIELVRVLHGARDVEAVLCEED